jgi:hypothetical protein
MNFWDWYHRKEGLVIHLDLVCCWLSFSVHRYSPLRNCPWQHPECDLGRFLRLWVVVSGHTLRCQVLQPISPRAQLFGWSWMYSRAVGYDWRRSLYFQRSMNPSQWRYQVAVCKKSANPPWYLYNAGRKINLMWILKRELGSLFSTNHHCAACRGDHPWLCLGNRSDAQYVKEPILCLELHYFTNLSGKLQEILRRTGFEFYTAQETQEGEVI